ncbi:flagellar hook-length control protein FliK [Aestuariirhabdus sp. LZHN29]|uniref:flagellar hook-length control protein FliK n=1 Tax=Aestuariirhabdus sp. LZHN29 TaxID=3417462 RepID=UPI003CF3FE48
MSIDPPKPTPPRPPVNATSPLIGIHDGEAKGSDRNAPPSPNPVGNLLQAIKERSPPELVLTIKAIQSYLPGKEPVIELTRDPTLLVRALVAGKELLLATRQLPPPNQPLVLVAKEGVLSLQVQQSPAADSSRSQLLQQLQQLIPYSRRPLVEYIRQLASLSPPSTAPPATPALHSRETLQALHTLAQQLPTPASLSTPLSVREQLQRSGLHLEGLLAQQSPRGSSPSPSNTVNPQGPPAGAASASAPDLKAALLTTLQTVAASGTGAPKGNPPLLQLLALLMPAAKPVASSGTPYGGEHLPLTPPHFPQFTTATPSTDARITSNESSPQQLMLHLATALARLQTQQILSLVQQQTAGADPGAPLNSWLYELPVRNEQQLDSIQLLIEQYAHQEKKKRSEQSYRWQINLAFEIAPLAPFQALISLIDNRAAITLWADAPQTLQMLGNEIGGLHTALTAAGLEVEELRCKRGLPIPRETRLARSLVDIHT